MKKLTKKQLKSLARKEQRRIGIINKANIAWETELEKQIRTKNKRGRANNKKEVDILVNNAIAKSRSQMWKKEMPKTMKNILLRKGINTSEKKLKIILDKTLEKHDPKMYWKELTHGVSGDLNNYYWERIWGDYIRMSERKFEQKGGFIAGGSRIPQDQFSVLPEPTVKQTGGAKKCKCTCGKKNPKKVKASKNVKSSGSLLKKDGRISAGEYYRKHGETAIGSECVIRKDGTKKCLKKRANGVVFWGKCAKKKKKCKEQIYGL